MVTFYLASYGTNNSTVTSRGHVLHVEPWWSDGERDRTIILGGKSLQVRETVLQSPQSAWLLWSWHSTGERPTGNRYVAKLLLAKARLFRRHEGSMAITVASEAGHAVDAAGVLQQFVSDLSPTTIQVALEPRTRDR